MFVFVVRVLCYFFLFIARCYYASLLFVVRCSCSLFVFLLFVICSCCSLFFVLVCGICSCSRALFVFFVRVRARCIGLVRYYCSLCGVLVLVVYYDSVVRVRIMCSLFVLLFLILIWLLFVFL